MQLLLTDKQLNCENQNGEIIFHRVLESSSFTFGTLGFLIESGAKVNLLDSKGENFIHKMFSKQEITLEIVQMLEKSMDPNIQNFVGDNCLHIYFSKNKINEIVALSLLDLPNIQVNTKNKKGETVLFKMFKNSQVSLKIIKKHIENGANPQIVSYSGISNVHNSISTNQKEKTNFLREILKEEYQEGSLKDSIVINDLNSIDHFLKHGADLGYSDNENTLPIFQALSQKEINFDTLKYIIQKTTSLFFSLSNCFPLFIFFLKIKDFDPNLKNPLTENTLLYSICESPDLNLQHLKFFCELKCDPNFKCNQQKTCVYPLFANNNVNHEMVEYILNQKADINLAC